MSLTYGYDLKGSGDKMIAAPIPTLEIMSPLVFPGVAMVNHLPFRAISYFIPAVSVSHSYP